MGCKFRSEYRGLPPCVVKYSDLSLISHSFLGQDFVRVSSEGKIRPYSPTDVLQLDVYEGSRSSL